MPKIQQKADRKFHLKCAVYDKVFVVRGMQFFMKAWVFGENIDEQVRFCPFCGKKLYTTPEIVDETEK